MRTQPSGMISADVPKSSPLSSALFSFYSVVRTLTLQKFCGEGVPGFGRHNS